MCNITKTLFEQLKAPDDRAPYNVNHSMPSKLYFELGSANFAF